MIDLLLDPLTHDLVVYSDLQLIDSVSQRIKQRLLVLAGEWFLDKEKGLPYIDELFSKKEGDTRLIESVIRKTIVETPGVKSLLSFSVNYRNEERVGSISFTVSTTEGLSSLEVVL